MTWNFESSKPNVTTVASDDRMLLGVKSGSNYATSFVPAGNFLGSGLDASFGDITATGDVDFSGANSFTTISGNWTPTIYGATTAGSPTGTFEGRYSIFSNDEFVYRGRVLLTSKGGMSGVIRIGGFPFNTVADNASRATVSIGLSDNYTLTAGEILTADVQTGVDYMRLNKTDNTGLAGNVADSELTDTFQVYFEVRGRIA